MLEDIFRTFPREREERLRQIQRFSMFDVFFYRSSLWYHTLRVFLIINELAPLAEKTLPNCDLAKARILALVHDDAEMITGDVQLGHKQAMTKEQLKKVDDEEAGAIEKLGHIYPESVGGYNYKELLYHALRKDCIEAQLVSYADKLDAYCESLHEIFGGNILALRAVLNYSNLFSRFGDKLSSLKPLLTDADSPLINLNLRTDQWRVHQENYKHVNRPHTLESIQKDTEIPIYNTWKRLVVNGLGDEGVEILTTQKEFL